jgi:hypothetical protein
MGNSEQQRENKAAEVPDHGGASGLLRAWSDGDRAALDRLTPVVCDVVFLDPSAFPITYSFVHRAT